MASILTSFKPTTEYRHTN